MTATLKQTGLFKYMREKKLGDFYWAYADILRGIGINESMYDQRIMAFMALKLLIDNAFLKFDFDYKENFGLDHISKYKAKDSKSTFLNILSDIENLGTSKLKYFKQEKKFNPDASSSNILHYINHPKTFHLKNYIEELPNNYFEMVLDIYVEKAHFINYPKEDYKDLYEQTISRMKKLSGDLTGQHFTQKSIIHLMCEMSLDDVKEKEKLAIYDPTCGTGSMLMESAYYFSENTNIKDIELYGQELHGQTWLLAKIFLEITEQKNIIAYGNTLTNPAFSKGINGKDSFDFIIANPPFGVDWKHDYEKIIENLKSEDTHFFKVVDKKRKIITPKKSDGQFLFMMHIIKLMQKESNRGKRAKAGIISSSTLISTGSDTGSEAKIREAIFGENIVSGVLEQPNAMFTNTDISSHIWFLDTDNISQKGKIKLVKADTKEEKLFSQHPSPKDKMKNSYSKEDIKKIKKYFRTKKDYQYISKTVNTKRFSINVSNEIGFKDTRVDVSFEELFSSLDELMGDMCKVYKNSKLI
jgi:type I restriction enzyme M protein